MCMLLSKRYDRCSHTRGNGRETHPVGRPFTIAHPVYPAGWPARSYKNTTIVCWPRARVPTQGRARASTHCAKNLKRRHWQDGSTGSRNAPELVESKSMRGMGFMAQVLPAGEVPVSTNVPLMGHRVPLFHCSACAVRTKSSGVFWKHASVSGSDAGHRRY